MNGDSIKSILQFVIAAALLVVIAFVAFYVFLFLIVAGVIIYLALIVWRWLIMKGIVNPPSHPAWQRYSKASDANPTHGMGQGNTIETEYTVIDEEKDQ